MSETAAVTLGLNRKPNYFDTEHKIFLVTIIPIYQYTTDYTHQFRPWRDTPSFLAFMRGLHQGSNSSARLDAFIVLREIRGINETSWSDWQDSNLRPLPPQGSVLPNWTTTRYQGLLKESLNSNAFHFSLYAITMLRNLTYDVPMVGGVGFEPTHPKGPDLQSGAALQLDRPPKYIALPCICLTSTLATYRPTLVPGGIWVA